MYSGRERSGGTDIGITARRKYRSSRKLPLPISSSRFLFVAAMTRTSTLMVRADPSRSTSPSCSTRSTLACVLALMSPTSSRKIVPRSACSNLPTCFSVAPVNDPFSWPKSSDSISSSGIAAQAALIQRVAQDDEHALARKRLLDEIECALLGGLDRGADRAVARDHHDRQRIVHRPQPIEHLEAVHARHLDVEQHQIRRLALDQREAFLPGRRADKLVPLVLEGHAQ